MSEPGPRTPVFPLALATVAGIGYAPVASGTFGSAAGLILWVLLPGAASVQALVIVLLAVAGSWSSSVAERYFAATDPSQIVVDELMGMLVTLFMIPVGWKGALAGFFLFRVFDVIKPFPANRLERLPAGMGVMADDFMASVYANLALRFTLWILGTLQ